MYDSYGSMGMMIIFGDMHRKKTIIQYDISGD